MPEVISHELKQAQGSEQLQSELEREFGNIPELESVEPIVIPNSKLRGVHLVLKEGNEVTGEQFVSAIAGGKITRKSIDKFMLRYPVLLADNMRHYWPGTPHFPSNVLSQPLHHDAVFESRALDLYHPPLKQDSVTYKTPRLSPTLIADPATYWPAFAKFVQESVYSEGEEMPESQLIVELIEKTRKGPEFFKYKNPRNSFQVTKIAGYLKIPEDSFQVRFMANVMDHFFEYNDEYHKRYQSFLENQYQPNLLEHHYKPEQLLVFDNFSVVHGRGAIPNVSPDYDRDDPMTYAGKINDYLIRKNSSY